MKIRSVFVSNSSSSSFIIQFKDSDSKVRIAGADISIHDFFNYIDTRSSFELNSKMHEITYDEENKDKLIKFIDDQFQYENKEMKQKLLVLKEDILNNNQKFARFNLSFHDKVGNFLINLLSKYDLFSIRHIIEK